MIGAGAVGLAIARALALRGLETVIVERETRFGCGMSSRNSEVIHSGLYYPTGSLKARLCTTGRERLYEYCERHAVPHRRCGKLIVATSVRQIDELAALQRAAERNGLVDLVWLEADAARALEPELSCVAALLSPSTGIIDSHAFMLALLADAERHGAVMVCGSAVTRVRHEGLFLAICVGAAQEAALRARVVINSAGLDAVNVARGITDFPAAQVHEYFFAKGNYFMLTGRSPFSRLVYPLPEPAGLGVHLTFDLAGRARFGPDVQWVEAPDYDIDPARAASFYPAIRAYWPGLQDGQLLPGYAGVRPKLTGPGEPGADFHISGERSHGFRGVINLFGIESPGLTASLAIAELVADLALESLDTLC